MNWYLKVVRDNYANFEGRARRKEYWMFYLINLLISFGINIIAGLSGIEVLSYLGLIYSAAVLIPSLAVVVRRLHDIGKSGWMFLIVLIPIVGAIWLLVLLVTDGNSGPNKYGPDPKGSGEDINQIGQSEE